MVGGRIIEISVVQSGVSCLWCVDRNGDECAVKVENTPAMPLLGDEIWWQAGVVYWDSDRRQLRKVGNSYDPQVIV
jgi:hypothetical protein